ncbi:hypothetical protein EX30DRAFT_374122 [Ascodesmis nigricans]|uniref:Uncharacterized protein n=1 Tax=Ascodesmis nigricans TaxID=341454 RepID=A0A4S2MR58_9PEZI|nr:hypothetical protein EX30DRAFT_374122 [Ascodesmis nigricans]
MASFQIFDAVPDSTTATPTAIPSTQRHRRYASSPYLSPNPAPTQTPYLSPSPSPPTNISWSRFHHQHAQYTPQTHPNPHPPVRPISPSRPPPNHHCEYTSLVIATEDAEALILNPLLDEIRRVVTKRAERAVQAEYCERVEDAWGDIRRGYSQRRGGRGTEREMGEVLQNVSDALWRECVQKYPAVLGREYKRVEEVVRGRGWRGEERELVAGEERERERGYRRGERLRVYTG